MSITQGTLSVWWYTSPVKIGASCGEGSLAIRVEFPHVKSAVRWSIRASFCIFKAWEAILYTDAKAVLAQVLRPFGGTVRISGGGARHVSSQARHYKILDVLAVWQAAILGAQLQSVRGWVGLVRAEIKLVLMTKVTACVYGLLGCLVNLLEVEQLRLLAQTII